MDSAETSFSFLVTTDNHLGFKEDDHIRRKDSYMAFKEALAIARNKDVDFILLGGDLFHMNRPSASVEHKCIKIIRQHMNAPASKGTSFKRVKGNFSHFHKLNHANFEDTNLTVPYPILTIHGNHDDPTGPNAQSVCAKLATCGLLNYFGALKPGVKGIVIEPIVLQKGKIKIAIYGLGFISDTKLRHAFDNGEVIFIQPPPDTFNILVVHQNRVPYVKTKYIPDDLFPTNLHLIIRGHEHDSQPPRPILDSEVNGYVYQPGSTVATSISNLEEGGKSVGHFTIKINQAGGNAASLYKMEYSLIKLKSCRKMICKDIPQADLFRYIKPKLGTKVTSIDFKRLSQEYVVKCLEELLEQNPSQSLDDLEEYQDREKMKRLKLPIIKLRLEYASKAEKFDEFEVSAMFYPNKVANKDIVYYKKQKLTEIDGVKVSTTFEEADGDNEEEGYDEFEHINLGEEKRDIDIMIEDYFHKLPPEKRLQALSLKEYTNAVRGSNEDGNVISKVLNSKKREILSKFKQHISSEVIAASYDNVAKTKKWFLDAFKEDLLTEGGDSVKYTDLDIIEC